MSSSYKSSVKEMRKEKSKARKHPKNIRQAENLTTTSLEQFGVKVALACHDCGQTLTDSNARWVMKEDKKTPYCRSCFQTRFGKAVSKGAEA